MQHILLGQAQQKGRIPRSSHRFLAASFEPVRTTSSFTTAFFLTCLTQWRYRVARSTLAQGDSQ